MENLGSVVDTFSAIEGSSGLPRPQVENIELIKEFGIHKDKFAGKDLNRTVMIIGTRSYEIAQENNIDLVLGSYGENILLDFDPHNLLVGDILHIGDAKIEVTEVCTVCSHLRVFGKSLPKLIAKKRGLYCKILESGNVTKKMNIYKGKK